MTDDDIQRDPRTITKPLPKLQTGKSYYWKVAAEDGEGGVVESQTRRFQLK